MGKGETGSYINSEGHGIELFGDLNFIGNNGNASNFIYEHTGSGIRLGQTNTTSANSSFIVNNTIGGAGFAFVPLSSNGIGIEVANGNTNLIQDNIILNSGVNSGSGEGIKVNGDGTVIKWILFTHYLGLIAKGTWARE